MKYFLQSWLTSPLLLLAMLLGLVVLGETALLLQLEQSTAADDPHLEVAPVSSPHDAFQPFTRDAGAANDCFGATVDCGDSLALIGCPRQSVDGSRAGAAHLFARGPRGQWRTAHTFTRPELRDGAMFGSAVAVDGDRLLIGVSPNEMHPADDPIAYAYTRSGDKWVGAALHIDGGEACLVHSISLDLDGDTAIVGRVARLESDLLANQVCIFRAQSNGAWKRIATLDPGGEAASASCNFGAAVALSGTRAIVGAPLQRATSGNIGAAFVYEEDRKGQWQRTAILAASDGEPADCFGASVALAGDTALVGAMGAEREGMNSGQAYVFRASSGGRWTQTANLAPDDLTDWSCFGTSVALNDGLAVVGAPGLNDAAGAIYVFRLHSDGISPLARHTPAKATSRSSFGQTVAAAGNTILAGAPWEDAAGLENSGAAYALEIPNLTAFSEVDSRRVTLVLHQK